MAEGKPVCIFGLSPACIVLGQGSPWLLGTDEVERYAFAFLRRNKAMVRRWLDITPVLENWVDARNHGSIRWLRWLNFTIHAPSPYGRMGLPFHRFDMRAS